MKVLRDPSVCQYSVVSIPEDLSVTESVELSQILESEFSIQPKQILNQVLQLEAALSERPTNAELINFQRHLKQIHSRTEGYAKRLSRCGQVRQVSMVVSHDPWKIISSLAQELST